VNIPKHLLKQVPFAVAIALIVMGYTVASVVAFGIGLGIAIWQAVEKVKREDE
jgi:flagellar biosynthesis protein FliQ